MNCNRRVGNLLFDVVEEMLMVKLQSGTPKLFPIPTSAHSYCLVPKVPSVPYCRRKELELH